MDEYTKLPDELEPAEHAQAAQRAHSGKLTTEKPSRNIGETGVTSRKYSSNEDEINSASRIRTREAQT